MPQTEHPSPPSAEEKSRDRKKWLILLLLLLFFVLVTSCMVGYILGKHAGQQPLGQVIDTILLSPDDTGTAARTKTHITGRAVYTDGSPAAERRMELHSDPISTTTDADGRFLFPNAEFGPHTILLYNPDGSLAAERKINISQEEGAQNVAISKEDNGDFTITMAIDVRILELVIEVDHDQIDLKADTFGSDSGWVITPTGSASVSNGSIVTPAGNVLLPDGTIVIPNRNQNGVAAIILPDDTVIYPDKALQGKDYTIQPDGTVHLSDGTEIQPGGTITTPAGEAYSPGESGVIVTDGATAPIGGTPPQQQQPPRETAPSTESNGGTPPSVTPTPSPDPGGSTGPTTDLPPATTPSENPGSPVDPPPSQDPNDNTGTTPTPPVAPDDPPGHSNNNHGGGGSGNHDEDYDDSGVLDVTGEMKNTGTYVSWSQNSIIDLFYNRTSGLSDQVAPGSSGFYRFQLENTRSRDLNITLTLTEGKIHLPLKVTLTPLDSNGTPLTQQAVSGSIINGKLSLQGKISAKGRTTYRLDWAWPFEGNDKTDTAVGKAGGVYTLNLQIYAAER